jgi:hypothetical protein
VPGEDETLESGPAHVHHKHVEDDPLAGIPLEVETVPADDAGETP